MEKQEGIEPQTAEKNSSVEKGNSNIHKVELGVAAVLFVASLNPREVKPMHVSQEPTPLVESFTFHGPFRTSKDGEIITPPSISAPFCYQEFVNWSNNMELIEEEKEMQFDSSVLGIENWEEMGMSLKDVELEEKGHTIQVSSDEAEVYSIPLLGSTFIHKKYNDERPVKKFSVPEGMVYEILEKREIKGKNGETINIGLISNNYLKHQALVIVMNAKDKYGVEKNYVTEVNGINQEALELSISDTYTLSEGDNVNTYQVNGEYSKQIDLLYSLEDLNSIQEYIKDDEVVQSFIRLRDLFKEYDIRTNDLPMYLKTTPWYEEMVQKNGKDITDEALKIPYIVKISTQPLQCVGFVEMMEELYPELNMVDISSMETSKGAQSLIPSTLLSYPGFEKPREVPLYQGGVGIGGNGISIEDYQRGDIFIINGGDFGHVGLILGKYEVKGRTVLLLADSNKLMDGMVRLYLVNDENIDEVLGEQKYILRNK